MNDWRARLRLAIRQSGKRHSEVAREARVAPETLSAFLNDPDSRPPLDAFLRIVHAVNETAGWVLEERGDELSWHDRRLLREVGQLFAELTDAKPKGK